VPRARRAQPRLRRSAEEARELILDGAEKQLAAVGPAGIRLQELATEVGISHPTILHHFGNREALVEAVVNRALEALQRDVLAALASEQFEEVEATELVSTVMRTLADRGHARLLAWLALEGRSPQDENQMLRQLARMVHARRLVETDPEANEEDTLFVVVLMSLALLAEGVLGPNTWKSAGLDDDPRAPERFHAWLVELLARHLHGPSVAAPPTRRGRTRNR
jgi:AcrR family transcriptional regulator